MRISSLIFLLIQLQIMAFAQSFSCLEQGKSYSGLSENDKLNTLVDQQWRFWMKVYPEYATAVGYGKVHDAWTDQSEKAIEQRRRTNHCFRQLLNKIDRTQLNDKNLVTYLVAMRKNKEIESSDQFGEDYLVIDQMSGIQFDLIDMLESAPQEQLQDFDDRLERLNKFPILIQQLMDLMSEGAKKGITPVQFLMAKVPAQIESLYPQNVEDSPIYKSFQELKIDLTPKQKAISLANAKEIIIKKVYPALDTFKNFLLKKYIPHCRDKIAFSEMPQGVAWYKSVIEMHTTTSLTADAIHQLGLGEVDRINKKMDELREQLLFKGNLEDFKKFMSTDSQFFYSNPKELITNYRDIAKKIDPELPHLFLVLPRLTYGVREMAEYKAKSAPTAYYIPGSASAGRAGYFEANTYDLKARPKWEMEVLTLHEAVPGHHLQISMAQEIVDLPEFRKHESHTAFVEGWGLYAESLGSELGLYKDLYSQFGQLSFDMWRAVRLVVDTGIHSKGWSKQKALEYFMNYVPKTRLQSENEIDRYITMPGQALAYKIGQRKIFELKAKAKSELKEKFDVREFHNEILKNGSLPLDVLEELIKKWIAKKRN